MKQISDIVCDSRKVTPGALFFAIPGTCDEGSKYIAEARARGAKEVWGTSPLCDKIIDNPRKVFAETCADFFGNPSQQLLLCGITGTNGKTTTAWLLQAMLAQGGLLPGLMTTVAIEWQGHSEIAERTTPDARAVQSTLAQMLNSGCRAAVMEVSSHALCQERVGATRFALTAFTNLTQDHLDYHGSMEAYFAAKVRLFTEHPEAHAVINADDPYGQRLLALLATRSNVHPYSLRDVEAHYTPTGTDLTLTLKGRTFHVHTTLCGEYNVQNILCAATAAVALGVAPDAVIYALASAKPRWGRLEPIAPHVFVDYAHTDDALTNVLKTLRTFTKGRLICLFGCGGDRDKTKRPRMGAAVDQQADLAIVTSDNPRSEAPEAIIADILPGFQRLNPIVIPDRREAIAHALAIRQPEDILLVAGKGHEDYQEIQGVKHPYSDITTIRNLLA